MRIGKRGFQARIKGDLHIDFGDEKLTSFAGFELVRRLLRALDFASELRRSERKLRVGGDLSLGAGGPRRGRDAGRRGEAAESRIVFEG